MALQFALHMSRVWRVLFFQMSRPKKYRNITKVVLNKVLRPSKLKQAKSYGTNAGYSRPPGSPKKLAEDIVLHYEALCAEKPHVVQKAMIVCADRGVAFRLLKDILAIRPAWGEKRRAENEMI